MRISKCATCGTSNKKCLLKWPGGCCRQCELRNGRVHRPEKTPPQAPPPPPAPAAPATEADGGEDRTSELRDPVDPDGTPCWLCGGTGAVTQFVDGEACETDRRCPVCLLSEARAAVEVIEVLEQVHAVFQAVPHREKNDPEFSLNLLDQQIIEARQHLKDGRLDKMAAEVADCVSIAWQAFYWYGLDPRKAIVERVRTRIIPRAAELAARDRAGNGYKTRTASPPEVP